MKMRISIIIIQRTKKLFLRETYKDTIKKKLDKKPKK